MLRGGFGNQLFQYSYAFALARSVGAVLIVDDGWYRGRRPLRETARDFALASYDLQFRLPTQGERILLCVVDLATKLQKRLRLRFFPLHLEGMPLTDRRLRKSPVLFLQGYWQSFQQVEGVLSHLRSALHPPASACRFGYWQMRHMIEAHAEPVFVHVRRGDYLSNVATASHHGHCTLDYYAAAFARIRSLCANPHFFLFSDDLAWASESLPFADLAFTPVDLGSQPQSELAELDLMKRCHHAVIANSTFSWWGAVLIDHPDSIVVAPYQWFAKGPAPELYAPGWIVL